MDQYVQLINLLKKNQQLMRVFDALEDLGFNAYYIGAGAIVQTVWNQLCDQNINHGISDIDIIFFDENNLSEDYEDELRAKLLSILENFPLWLDVKNQARVHLWYEGKFGYPIAPYKSLEEAINTWPTSASAIGVRRSQKKWYIYAPFGIEDLMSMIVRPNSRQITEKIYLSKQVKWSNKWEGLNLIDWSDQPIELLNHKLIEVDDD